LYIGLFLHVKKASKTSRDTNENSWNNTSKSRQREYARTRAKTGWGTNVKIKNSIKKQGQGQLGNKARLEALYYCPEWGMLLHGYNIKKERR
jgi:hypothetical protein